MAKDALFAISILVALVCRWEFASSSRAAEPPPAKRLSLAAYLYQIGVRHDVYFTVEEKLAKEGPSKLLDTPIDSEADRQTLDRVLAGLEKKLASFTIVRDKNNKAVIHIVDFRFQKERDYALEKETAIEYHGTPEGLLDTLKMQVPGLSGRTFYIIGSDVLTIDAISRIQVKKTKDKVRQILTNYLPLSTYNRILWVAGTFDRKGKMTTTIQFLGPARRELPSVVKEPVDFGLGEVAYDYTPASPQSSAAADALGFIKAQTARNDNHQVRWAMLFLGKCKHQAGIPVLLNHIDLQYTDCGIIEESYPAVRALREIGRPAAAAALAELAKATAELRIKLLSKVLIDTVGPSEAESTLRGQLSSTVTEQARRPFQLALDYCIQEKKHMGIGK